LWLEEIFDGLCSGVLDIDLPLGEALEPLLPLEEVSAEYS